MIIEKSKISVLVLIYFIFHTSASTFSQDNPKLTTLLETLDNSSQDTSKITVLLNISMEYKAGNLVKSLYYSQQALKLSEELDYEEKIAESLYQNATIYNLLRKRDSAMLNINLAKDIIKKGNKNDNFEGNLLSLEAYLLSVEGKYDEATKLWKKSLNIFNKTNYTDGLAYTYNAMAIQFLRRSVFDSAIYYLIKSNRHYSFAGDSIGVIKTLMNTGSAYANINDNQKALDYYLKAEKVLQNNRNERHLANANNSIGRMYSRLEKYDSALIYFDKSIAINDSIGLKAENSTVYLNQAGVYFELAQYDKALTIYHDALNIYQNNSDIEGVIMARSNIALINERLGSYTKALQIYDTCLTLAKEYEFNSQVTHTYFNIYRTWELKGNYKKAYEYQEIYNFWRDSIFDIEKAEIISDLEIKYDTEKKQAKILSLENETLTKDLAIKEKNNERNMAILIGAGVILILTLLLILFSLKSKKNRIIKEKEIQRLKEEKKALAAKSLLDGQEEERRRMARELHDGIGVLLSTVKMQFTKYIDKNPENTNILKKATSALDEASKDVRRISHNMMPGILSKLGMNEAIEDLFEEINDTTDLNAECLFEGETSRLSENMEIMIFRIVQEMVNNVLKHANASQISLVFNRLEKEIRMQFSDNGKGFNVDDTLEKKSMGIQSIQSRVNFLGGELAIESNGQKGTTFIIVIPQSIT